MTEPKKKLARTVTVGSKTYGPGDEVPDEAMKQIRNPKAWEPVDETEPEPEDADRLPAGTTSGAKLATTVTVASRSYGPRDHIPDAVAALIRNPKAWEGGKVPQAQSAGDESAPDAGDQSAKATAARQGRAAPTKSTAPARPGTAPGTNPAE